MMKINSYAINIYIPYMYFPEATIILKRQRDLSEIEAIIYSFICENKTKSQSVLNTLFSSFNIDSSKWSTFFKEIINDSIKNSEIITEIKEIDENTMFGDIQLHKSIIANIRNHKFSGLDSKDIERKVIFNKAMYESICNNNDNYIIDRKLLKIDNLYLNFEDNSYDKNEINSILLDKFYDVIKKENKNEQLEIIKSTGVEDYQICFNPLESKLDIEINESINISSSDKTTHTILNKFNEKNINVLIIRSIEDGLDIKNRKFDSAISADLSDLDIIDFNEYSNVLNKLDDFNSKFKVDKKFIIKDGYLYDIFEHEIPAFILNIKTDSLTILCQQKVTDSCGWIINEIESNNGNIISILDFINQNDKIKVIEHLVNNMSNYWTNPLFKNYLINNILIENKLNKSEILPILISNLIDINDYKKLLQNNRNAFEQFINTIDEINNDQNNQLINRKMMYTFDIFKIDILKLPFSKIKNSLIAKINEDFILCKNFIEKDQWDKNSDDQFIKIKKSIYELNSILLNNSFEEIYQGWSALKIKMREDLEKEFAVSCKLLQEKLEEFTVSDVRKEKSKKFEEAIGDIGLREKFKKIRIFRNEFTHSKKMSEYNFEKLENNIKLMNDYLTWLNDKKNLIYESIKNKKGD